MTIARSDNLRNGDWLSGDVRFCNALSNLIEGSSETMRFFLRYHEHSWSVAPNPLVSPLLKYGVVLYYKREPFKDSHHLLVPGKNEKAIAFLRNLICYKKPGIGVGRC